MGTLIVASILSDSTEATIQDTTTYTTPTRSDYHSQFYAYKVDELDQETAVDIASQGTVTSADTWNVTTDSDGFYRFKLLLYPIWVSGAFTTGDIVSENGVLYVALTDNSTEPEATIDTDWEVHPSVIADEDAANVVTYTLECILFSRLKACFAKEVARVASIACDCDVDKQPLVIQKYERLAVLLDGIAVDNYQTRYLEGEKKVQYMSNLCPNCS